MVLAPGRAHLHVIEILRRDPPDGGAKVPVSASLKSGPIKITILKTAFYH